MKLNEISLKRDGEKRNSPQSDLRKRLTYLKKQAHNSTLELSEIRKQLEPQIERDRISFEAYSAALNVQIADNFATIIDRHTSAIDWEDRFFKKHGESDDPRIIEMVLKLADRQSDRLIRVGNMMSNLYKQGLIKPPQTNVQINVEASSLSPARRAKLEELLSVVDQVKEGVEAMADGAKSDAIKAEFIEAGN